MKGTKVAVIHFQPLELYPPVMNMIDFLIGQKRFSITCISTRRKSPTWFHRSGVKIFRYGKQSENALFRYWSFFRFNFQSFLKLLLLRPEQILYYETYSSLPVFFFLKFFPKTKLLIHYHEYTSPEEIAVSSRYYQFLLNRERSLFKTADWISHTNKDRLRLFLLDNKLEKTAAHQTLSNYPPANWIQIPRKANTAPASTIRIVYVGALSLDTMYFREFAQWVETQNGRVEWDVYSNQNVEKIFCFLRKIKAKFIRVKDEVNYFDLPFVLSQYDFGVILYKAHIKNFEFNAPNKLFEYLSCGLAVLYPVEMQGCKLYSNSVNQSKLIELDFNDMSSFQLNYCREHFRKADEAKHSCDEEYKKIEQVL